MRGSDNGKARVALAGPKNTGIRVTHLWEADTDTIAVLVRDDSTSDSSNWS